MNLICQKLKDGRYYIIPKKFEDKVAYSLGSGDSELEAWKLAENNAKFMKNQAEKDVSEANEFLHEIIDALKYF